MAQLHQGRFADRGWALDRRPRLLPEKGGSIVLYATEQAIELWNPVDWHSYLVRVSAAQEQARLARFAIPGPSPTAE